MKVLVLEDEAGAAQNLLDNLKQLDQDIQILDVIETVEDAVSWLEHHDAPDLGFFDIRLADGDSFQVVEKVDVKFPIIFTTAYDEYALRAFKVNSIDYLLKPIDKADLEHAFEKYTLLVGSKSIFDNARLMQLVKDMNQKENAFKKAFLIHHRGSMIPIDINNIAYFYLVNGILKIYTHNKLSYVMEETLNEVEAQLDPAQFYRANRQVIVARKAILAADHYFHRKLKLNVTPPAPENVLVSKEKVRAFMKWLGGEG